MDTVRFDRMKDLRDGPLCTRCGQTAARHPDFANFHKFTTEDGVVVTPSEGATATPITSTESPAGVPVAEATVVE